MNMLQNVSGIVLSVMPVGDYDRRVTILTKEKGKIAAFARGARRPGNNLIAVTQPCIFGEFSLFSGRDSFTISEVKVQEYFSEIREDLDSVYYAMYFCEVADFYTKEGNDEREMMKLLYTALKALVRGQMSRRLVRSVFEMRTCVISGEGPMLNECVVCHEKIPEDSRGFSVLNGGAVCEKCREKLPVKDVMVLNPSSRYALWFICSTPAAKLFSFTVSPEVEDELAALSAEYLFARVKHTFKGEKLLELISD